VNPPVSPGRNWDVTVLVPYRPGPCPHRAAAWEWVRRWWATRHPDWPLVTAEGPAGVWRKGAAVAAALTRSGALARGGVVVVADADVVCRGMMAAVRAVAGGAPWAVPHRAVLRLSPAGTAAVYAGAPLPDPAAGGRLLPPGVAERHRGLAGGGLVVLPAATLAAVPLDPRFTGWGQEDMAWGRALGVAAGGAWRGVAPLWHLWHPPAPRDSRTKGNPAGWALWRRYRTARRPAPMALLLAEAQAALREDAPCTTP
jgi:hypothetical protein